MSWAGSNRVVVTPPCVISEPPPAKITRATSPSRAGAFTTASARAVCNRSATRRRTDEHCSRGAAVALIERMDLRLRHARAFVSREWRTVRTQHPRLAIGGVPGVLGVAAASTVGSAWFLVSLFNGLPDTDALHRMTVMDQATAVFDTEDQLAFTVYKEQRIDVPLSEVSENLTKALLSVEDQRFYQHRGFDLVRIGSAALANIRHGRRAQGGSTLTQQLARQSFLTTDKTFHRKLQELVLAARIERLYTKDQILALYLNKVYFGDGLYGIEAASRGYFGKHASELTVAEAAMLAG